MGYANKEDYYEIDAKKWKPLGDRIMVQWEEKKDDLLDGKLLMPDTHKKQHYTGIVLSKGEWVSSNIEVGDRIIFGQFSGFEKFFDKNYGRIAVIEEGKQSESFAIIPRRSKIENGELDFDYAS